ncbi:hypothetical protein [Glaesserella sp.]|uniref:hypothetical protein n=1 Tax=Glaesserella sp. TaxID=2094731 RepID=UPI0035A1BFBC
MEWYGIDLSGGPTQKWVKTTILNLGKLCICLLIATLFAVFIYWEAVHLEKKNKHYLTQINQLKQQIKNTTEAIEQLKNHQSIVSPSEYITAEKITLFTAFLQHFPLQGSLEISQLYLHNGTKIKLIGKLTSPKELEQLEKSLTKNRYRYSIENLQTNDKHQIDFSLIIQMDQ